MACNLEPSLVHLCEDPKLGRGDATPTLAVAEPWGAEEIAATLDLVGTPVWVLDREGRCLYINRAACQLLDSTREECLGQWLQCRIHRGNCAGWVCASEACPFQTAIASGAAVQLDDDMFQRQDGTRVAARYSIRPVIVAGRVKGTVISLSEIAAQKRAEEALRKSDEWLRFAQDAAGVGIFDLDLKTGESTLSEGQARLLGQDPGVKAISVEQWRNLIHPDDVARMSHHIEAALSGDQPAPAEYRVVWPDGSVHWLFAQRNVIFDEAGKPARMVGANVDITGRVHAETALEQFFSASPTPMAIWGLDGRIQHPNPAWESILGFTAAELEGQFIGDLVHPEDRAASLAEFEKVLTSGKTTGFECRCRRKDGSYCWVLVGASVQRDAQIVYATAHDITKRKRTEEALQDSEARFRSAFEHTLFGVAITNLDGRFLQVNQSFCQMTGFDEQELLQMDFAAITHPDDVPKKRELVRELVEGAIPRIDATTRYVRKGGQPVWNRASVALVRDAEGEPLNLIAMVEDLTDQKCAEEAARASEDWLRFSLDAAGIGLCYRESNETTTSEQQFRLYGIEPAEVWLDREQWLQLVHPEDRERVEFERSLAMEHGRPYDMQFRVIWPDGSIHWLLCRGMAVNGDRGRSKAEVTVDITERKLAEAALTAEALVRRTVFEQSRDGIVFFDQNAKVYQANQSYADMLGYSLAEMPQLHVWDWDDSLTRDQIFEMMRNVKSLPANFEVRHKRKDGSRFDAEISTTSIEFGGDVLYYAVVRDITARKLADAALAAEALLRRTVFEQSRDGIVIFDRDGKVMQSNRTFANMLGYSPEEMHQLYVWDWDAHFTRDQILEMMRNINSLPPTFETRHKRKDGSLLDTEISTVAVGFGGSELFHSVTRDVTGRKRAEKALRESEQRFNLIAETIDEVFWIINDDLTGIVYVSPAYAQVWGLSPASLYAAPRSFLQAVHPDDLDRTAQHLESHMAQRLPLDHEYRIIRPDGSIRWIWNHGYPNGVLPGGGYVGIAQDITDRKKMEQAVKAHSEKLARSNDELERFAYVASHDLQEPLRMVASFTQLLSKRYSGKLDETADRYINYAVDGARRMQQLISDLLAYSRVNSKDLEPRQTACEALVRGAIRNLTAAIGESDALVDWDPLPALWVDETAFTQLFQNLLGNAIKFRRAGESPHIRISAADTGAEWVLSVQDNGIGIDPRHAERVFQVFQRLHTRAEYAGTGIGLAVCQKVVERHGGRIWVESEPGKGSNFRFTLPKAQAVGRRESTERRTEAASALHSCELQRSECGAEG